MRLSDPGRGGRCGGEIVPDLAGHCTGLAVGSGEIGTITKRPSTRAIVIDDDGQAWDVRDRSLHMRLGARPDGSFDIAGFLADSAGWVAVSIRGTRLLARLNPPIAAPAAVATLRSIMASRPDAGVALAAMGVVTMLGKGARAQNLLSEKLIVHAPRVGPRFVSERHAVTELFRRQRRPLLASLARGRSIAHQRFVSYETAVQIAARDPSGGTSVAVARAAPNGTLRFTFGFIGSGLRIYDASDRQRLQGSDMRRSTDSDYTTWCTAALTRSVETAEPIVDEIRARVHRRIGAPVETHYLRLNQAFSAGPREWLLITSADILPFSDVA